MFKPDAPFHADVAPRTIQLGRLRLREDIAFADKKGKEKKGKRKAAEKSTSKLQAPLETFVESDETILYFVPVKSPISQLEQLTYGVFVHSVCATVLVLTERRFLHLRITGRGKWKEIISECAWSDIAEVKVKGWLSAYCQFVFKNGKKAKYWGIRRRDSTVLAKLLPLLIQSAQADIAPGVFVTSLCPECRSRLTAGVYQCNGCQLLFKNEKTVLKLMYLPGAVHFYCKEWGLGTIDVLGEGYLVLGFIGSLLLLFDALKRTSADVASAAIVLGFFCVLLSIDALISYAHGRRFVREFISTHRKAETATLSRSMAAGGTIG